jgi:HSP20 family protein
MALFRWGESWNALGNLERQVDLLLQSIPLPLPVLRVDRRYPPVNVYELDQEYILLAELPGTTPEDLEVSVSNGTLLLKGRRQPPAGVSEERFRRHERNWGSWERAIHLPDRSNVDQMSAEFTCGILKVRIPKSPESTPRQISVAQGNGK